MSLPVPNGDDAFPWLDPREVIQLRIVEHLAAEARGGFAQRILTCNLCVGEYPDDNDGDAIHHPFHNTSAIAMRNSKCLGVLLFFVRIDETIRAFAHGAGHANDAHFVRFRIASGKRSRFEE